MDTYFTGLPLVKQSSTCSLNDMHSPKAVSSIAAMKIFESDHNLINY